MRVRVVSSGELAGELQHVWTSIQRSRPSLASPYFSPGFVEAAAKCRKDARVGVVEDEHRPIGFFPFEVQRFGVGGPLGGRLSDFQGVIAPSGVHWRPEDLVAGCGLRMWRFDHLLCEQAEFAPFCEFRTGSPVMDLSNGFEDYRQRRRSAGNRSIDQVLRRARKLQREHGDVRFEFESRDPQALEQVIQWKRDQCQRTGVVDFLAARQNLALIHRIHETCTPGFAGVLSVLRVRDRVAAAHFGMRSHDTLHWWFPGYERALGRYSPGAILLLELARSAATRGLVRLDLGKGDDPYKRSFCTHETPVAEGAVVLSPLHASVRRWRRDCVRSLRTAPSMAPVRAPVRAFRKWLRTREAGQRARTRDAGGGP